MTGKKYFSTGDRGRNKEMEDWRDFLAVFEDVLNFAVLLTLSVYLYEAHPIPGCATLCVMSLLQFGWYESTVLIWT